MQIVNCYKVIKLSKDPAHLYLCLFHPTNISTINSSFFQTLLSIKVKVSTIKKVIVSQLISGSMGSFNRGEGEEVDPRSSPQSHF